MFEIELRGKTYIVEITWYQPAERRSWDHPGYDEDYEWGLFDPETGDQVFPETTREEDRMIEEEIAEELEALRERAEEHAAWSGDDD